MTAFWTGLVVGTVFGVFLGITAVMFFMGSRDRMTAEEWIRLREFRRVLRMQRKSTRVQPAARNTASICTATNACMKSTSVPSAPSSTPCGAKPRDGERGPPGST